VRLDHLRRLRGPNVHVGCSVVVARLDLEELTGGDTDEVPAFAERLLAVLPGLAEHHCATGRPGGFVSRLHGGTYFGHVTEHVALQLAVEAGIETTFGRTVRAGAAGIYDVMVQCAPEEVADGPVHEALRRAVVLVQHLVDGEPVDVSSAVAAVRRAACETAVGPSTASIAAAARRRGIPVERVDGESLLRLGWGRHRRYVRAAVTERTSAIGVETAQDKQLTRHVLQQAGIPVAEGCEAHSADEAVAALASLGGRVVVKPRDGHHGADVRTGLATPEEVAAAYAVTAARWGQGPGKVAILGVSRGDTPVRV
jgi:cyanophycin synthetase